jgi:TetR/AcrR family transcriptional repressor of nem operon
MDRRAAPAVHPTTSRRKTVLAVQVLPGGRDQTKGEATRERLLAAAEASVLAKGFSATSIEEIIAEAGLTKSGFFYHFRDKNELAREMMRRSIAADEAVFDDVFGRGREIADDPLQAFLNGLKLLAKVMADMPGGHTGCLIASICYQERLFDREVIELNRQALANVNRRFRVQLELVAADYPLREPIDLDTLAEMFSCIVDGAIIMAKVLDDPTRLVQQILAYRAFIKALFSPLPAVAYTPYPMAAE